MCQNTHTHYFLCGPSSPLASSRVSTGWCASRIRFSKQFFCRFGKRRASIIQENNSLTACLSVLYKKTIYWISLTLSSSAKAVCWCCSRCCSYHLQALRHLAVLAAEPRLLVPVDVDSLKPCYALLEVTYKVSSARLVRLTQIATSPVNEAEAPTGSACVLEVKKKSDVKQPGL